MLTGLRQGHSAKLSRSPKRQPLSYSGYLWLIRVPSEGQSARTHLADQADRRFKPCHNPVTPPQADLRAVSVCFHTNTITLYSTNNCLSIIFKKNLPAYFINSAKILLLSAAPYGGFTRLWRGFPPEFTRHPCAGCGGPGVIAAFCHSRETCSEQGRRNGNPET